MSITEEIRKRIGDSGALPEGGHVILGFSGGPDSSCLFDALFALSRETGFSLTAVHVNHGLRPVEADRDQRYVENICKNAGAPLTVVTADVPKLAKQEGISLEEAGRNVRYEAFDEAARAICGAAGTDSAVKGGAEKDGAENESAEKGGSEKYISQKGGTANGGAEICIALAHNRDDQSETLLMRLIRGTGPDGLAGIAASRTSAEGYRIIRPLIDTPKVEIERYCAERGLSPVRDSTNDSADYIRNSIRLELLPLLREKYNSSIDDALVRLSGIAATDRNYFEIICDSVIEESCSFGEDAEGEYAEIPLDMLAHSHPAIGHRLTKRVFEEIGLIQDISMAHLSAAGELARRGVTGKSVDFPGGYKFCISYEKALFRGQSDAPDLANLAHVRANANANANAPATGPDEALLTDIEAADDGIDIFPDSAFPLTARVMDYDGMMKSAASLVLDYDELSRGAILLRLRTRLPGDRIALPGMDGTKKLQDVFTDAKIPRGKRGVIPVVVTEKEVLWIVGVRHTRFYTPKDSTKRVLVLSPK